ncbi:MAG: cytochrome P450, partial [Chloroflexi bacterium]
TGLEATSAFIGNAALALVRHPDVRHELAGRPDRRPSAVEELLRFDSPVHLTARAATVDIDLDGHTVAAGEQVIVMLGAANRDPSRFQDPDRLDISRQDNQHLAFGHGAHSCFAAPLARLIGGPAVMTLAGLEMDLAGDPAWLDTVTMRGLRQLPVTLRT